VALVLGVLMAGFIGFVMHNFWEVYREAYAFEYILLMGLVMVSSLFVYMIAQTQNESLYPDAEEQVSLPDISIISHS
jgi:hypothetical protein